MLSSHVTTYKGLSMNMTLLHGSFEPLIYGAIIFLGIFSMCWKIKRGQFLPFFMEASVFWLVFKLHGGTMNGGFAATVAALLAGVILPWLFRSK